MSIKIDPYDIVGCIHNEIMIEDYLGTRFSAGRKRHFYQCRCIHRDIFNEICAERLELERYNAMTAINCGHHNVVENPKDIIGQVYGYLRVDKYMGRNNNHMHYYQCTCLHQNCLGEVCGNIVYPGRYHLFNGSATSCGCANRIDPYDIIGNTYGYLKVESYNGSIKTNSGTYHNYNCICNNIINGKICNNRVTIERNNLMSGRVISCGCYKSIVTAERCSLENPEDIVGQTFGYLEVKKYIGKENKEYGRHMYECLCHNQLKNGSICGKTVIAERNHLITGHTRSCGCLMIEMNKTHGLSKHRLYHIWHGMRDRCYNPNNHAYGDYGYRGIRVCDRWNDPIYGMQNFIDDMYPAYLKFSEENPDIIPSIDRIDVNGNYEPDNCRWATPKMQAYNKRTTAYFIYNGKGYTIDDLLREFCEPGLKYGTLIARLRHGTRFCKNGIIFNDEVFKFKLDGGNDGD